MFVAEFEKRQHVSDAETLSLLKFMQKADSNSSAGASADNQQKDEATFVSSNDTKPNVVGCHSVQFTLENANEIIQQMFEKNIIIHYT